MCRPPLDSPFFYSPRPCLQLSTGENESRFCLHCVKELKGLSVPYSLPEGGEVPLNSGILDTIILILEKINNFHVRLATPE